MFHRYPAMASACISHLSPRALGNQMESADAGTTSHRDGRAMGAQSHHDRALLSKPYLLYGANRKLDLQGLLMDLFRMFRRCLYSRFYLSQNLAEPGL